ncbi:MAG TPA: ABC transporter substrate-binding protein [Geminicoccaceae bacterium]|nr:ABC transporter substrate-binding protein [Geminicoccaceae bacterium]
MSRFTRRDTIQLGAGALAGAALLRPRFAGAQQRYAVKDVTPPEIPIEDGASLRVVRPSKFVDGDERLFVENSNRFTEKTGVQVTIDLEAWEDLRPKTAVAANIGSGPDIVLGWLDDPHQFPEKLVDLTDIAEYLGEKYGGWFDAPRAYGVNPADGRWIAMPIGTGGGVINYRQSWVQEAGFETFPNDFEGLLEVCKGLQRIGHPAGFALGNAVGDANAWTHWILWGFGSSVVDENNQVVVDNPKTIEALEYAKELSSTFIPGTLSWLDPNNNKAFLVGEIGLTHNGISIYYVAKNSDDPAMQAIAEDLQHASPPIGPVGHPTETSLTVNSFIFRHTPYPNAAKAYLLHMFEEDQYAPWQEASIGYWQHTLAAYDNMPFWTDDPKATPFRDIAKNLKPYFYKGTPGYHSAAVLADYVVVNMFASVCSGEATPKEAAAEAQRRAERYYKV